MKKFFYSFRARTILCVLIVAVGMTASEMIFINYYSKLIESEIYDRLSSLYSQLESLVSTNIESINEAARISSYQSNTQKYLFSPDASTVIFAASGATEYWDYAFPDGAVCKNLYIHSYNGRFLSHLGSYRDAIRQKISEYGFYDGERISEPFFTDIFYLNSKDEITEFKPGENSTPYAIYFSPIYSTLRGYLSIKNEAVCAILCDMSGFGSILDDRFESAAGIILTDDTAISTNGKELNGGFVEAIRKLENETVDFEYGGKQYIIKKNDLDNTAFSLVQVLQRDEVTGDLEQSRVVIISLFLFFTILLLVLLSLVLNNTVHSLSEMLYDTEHLRVDLGPNKLRIPKIHEFAQIASAFNTTLGRLDDSTEKEKRAMRQLYDSVISQKQAELIAYRSQINPHFLFNTLECVRSMAQVNQVEPIEKIVSSMGKMFRYSLYSAMVVRLRDEIEHVRSYMEVTMQRYPDMYTFKTHITDEAKDFLMFSMILQPIVENSVQHAFSTKMRNRHISIHASVLNERLIVKITDNGIGLSEESIQKINEKMRIDNMDLLEEKSSISLQNLYKRLKTVFGGHFHIRIYSSLGHYTSVELMIPQVGNFIDEYIAKDEP